MKMTPLSSAAIIIAFLLSAGMAYAQEAIGRRVALVVGNGAYQANPLRNPPNDAEDMAAALKDSGFEVSLVLNTSQEAFDKAVADFSVKLRGAETGLFYYAGHGVQVGGLNYLIPVRPPIDDEASVKSRAIAMDEVVGKMAATGVRTILIFLDSCRDNPLPRASRSGTRGLAVIATPMAQNSLIAYATSPGDTAQDGSGRNGVFSGALIKQLQEPGLELTVIMRNVRSEVAAVTDNKQQPRVDDGMKEPFFFISLDAVVAKARAERDKIASELAALEAQIAARDRSIAAAKSQTVKRDLEVEQQKVRALEIAKRLEVENAGREAERLEAEASRRRTEDEERRKLATTEVALVASLRTQAEARRAEYEKLTRADDSLDEFLRQIAALEASLAEIDNRYASAATQAEAAVQRFYDRKLAELGEAKPEDWESSAEFKSRIAKEKSALEGKCKAEISSRKTDLAAEHADAERELRARLTATENELAGKLYTVKGSKVSVAYGTYDRDTKTWPVNIASEEVFLTYSATLRHDISSAEDIRTAYTNVDTMLKAGTLAGEMDYRISRVPGSEQFQVIVSELRVLNLTNNSVIVRDEPNFKLYAMSAVELQKEYSKRLLGRFAFSSPEAVRVELLAGGSDEPTARLEGVAGSSLVEPGVYQVRASRPDDIDFPWKGTVFIQEGQTAPFLIPTAALNYSIVWRLREAENSTIVLRMRHEKAKEVRKTFDMFRMGGFIIGGAGAAASGITYFLGNAAMQDYRSATLASQAVPARQNATLYSILFGVSVITGGLGLATGVLAWMGAPNMDAIDRELDAGIKKLAELRVEKEAAR